MYQTRTEAIKELKAALKEATGRTWRVYGDRGTAYGWITIRSPKARAVGEWGYMSEEDQEILGRIFYGGRSAHMQGYSISPDSRERALQIVREAAAKAARS